LAKRERGGGPGAGPHKGTKNNLWGGAQLWALPVHFFFFFLFHAGEKGVEFLCFFHGLFFFCFTGGRGAAPATGFVLLFKQGGHFSFSGGGGGPWGTIFREKFLTGGRGYCQKQGGWLSFSYSA